MVKSIFSGRRSLLLIGMMLALKVLPANVSADNTIRIFDGEPKTLVHFQHASWGLERRFNYLFEDLGLDTLWHNHPDQFNEMPIDDDFNVIPGTWLAKRELENKLSGVTTPVVMIAYGSLGYENVSAADTALISRGVRRLEVLVDSCKAQGADIVFLTTKHYRMGRSKDIADPIRIHSDSIIFAEYNKRTNSHRAIDMYTPTREAYPTNLIADLEHPNNYGRAIYHVEWFRAMYREDGVAPPEDILTSFLDRFRDDELDKRSRMELTLDSPLAPESINIGDEIQVTFHANERTSRDAEWYRLILGVHSGPTFLMYRIGYFPITDSLNTETITIPSEAELEMYPLDGITTVPIAQVGGDSATIMAIRDSIGLGAWDLVEYFKLKNTDGSELPTTMIINSIDYGKPPSAIRGNRYFDVLGRTSWGLPGSRFLSPGNVSPGVYLNRKKGKSVQGIGRN